MQGSRLKNGDDGILTALEALSLNLEGTQLVVLSACETGVGEIKQGEGVYGLRRAFQEAGARAVLSTLWPVNDEATQIFMNRFYELYLSGVKANLALQKVKQEFIADGQWQHPYYWAPFVLVGGV